MRRYHWLGLLIVLAAAQGCAPRAPSPAPAAVASPAAPTWTPTPAPAEVRATPTPTTPTTEPTQPSAPTLDDNASPAFSPVITFAETPDASRGARSFAAGVKKVYALWNYSHMVDGLPVVREWVRDGKPWLRREEPWNFAKYGASGAITDIAIEDQSNGLPTGHYELRLYIDGVYQFSGIDDVAGRSFSIGRDLSTSTGTGGLVLSPDGKSGALIEVGNLSFMDAEGNLKTLVAKTVAGVSWLPDSRHLVYSTMTIGLDYPVDFSTELILVDVTTGARITLNPPRGQDNRRSNLVEPMASPDGRTVAALVSGYGDACFSGWHLAFVGLDPATLRPISETDLDAFAGMPETAMDYYPEGGFAWQSPVLFNASLRFSCGSGTEDGVYQADVSAQTVTKIAPLPKEQ